MVAVQQSGSLDAMDDDAHDKLHGLLHRYSEAVDNLEKMNLRPLMPSPPLPAQRDGDIEAKPVELEPEPVPFERVGVLTPRPPKSLEKVRGAMAEYLNFTLSTIIQLIFAGSMGAALVVPMLIMVLHPSTKNSLIVTCVFVFAFASSLVLFNIIAYLARGLLAPLGIGANALDGSVLQVKDIVGATAAYAAVLVVFVGTSISIH
ncbi:hypothetical protein LTR78_009416 [Recurvomyces mirabilis]|uniref:Uncharacterized protein n=1 Tax=Recurvomyces mirabilis TaxID=574656 RepID=A0AAE0TNT7_9PEZI|nr:hypothetical protein LTR78_009416 [Recurvomyces mirabilis]KAK5154296.1 hypothetical protein LTS14_006981 [Recurvomyces mirabilis]